MPRSFDTPLPIDAVLDQLSRTLADNNAAVLVAPPGAGKTTRVPLVLRGEPWTAGRKILVLGPRRLAARAAAARMAATLGEEVGRTVGLRVRFGSKVSADSRIEVVTDAWDDPGTPETDTTKFVSVTARSNGPDIDAFPPIIHFGTVAIGGNTTRPASLQNGGNAPLTVTSITLQSPTAEITMIGAPGGATVIQPGTSVDFQLSYTPTDAGADMAQIIVVSDDRDKTLARLYLVSRIKSVLGYGLGLLGVTAPEEMRCEGTDVES